MEPIQLVESVPDETSLGLPETARTLDVWLDLINGARESLDIETFYFTDKDGSPFDSILDSIRAAAQRGVRVRILTDAGMTSTYPRTVAQIGKEKNVETRTIAYFNQLSGVLHAKYFVVDHEALFLGSQNFDWRALDHIHELGVLVRDPDLASRFEGVFEGDWQLAADGTRIAGDGSADPITVGLTGRRSAQLVPAASPAGMVPPSFREEEALLVSLLDEARARIDVQLLLYSPVQEGGYYAVLDNALRRAAGRGVAVRIIVSNWNLREPGLSHLKSLALVPGILVGISAIPEHSSGFIPFARVEHCKYLLVDNAKTWIATGNWSRDYFHASRNLAIVFEAEGISATVSKLFNRSWDSDYVELLDPGRSYSVPIVSGPEAEG